MALMMTTTSCGGGKAEEVNKDTVVSQELADSISLAWGAFMGVNLQDEIRHSDKIDDYIEGYQLIVGQKFSHEKLMGMRQGLFQAEQFANLESEGIEINRDLYLQQFRKYLQQFDLPQEEYAMLYKMVQDKSNEIEEILYKREQMRRQASQPEATPTENEAPVEEVETETVDETIVTEGPDAQTYVVEEAVSTSDL